MEDFAPQNTIDYTKTTYRIKPFGYSFGLAWGILQFIVNFIALLLFVPWFYISYWEPILPAIEVASEPFKFTLGCSHNTVIFSRLNTMATNLDNNLIWSKLDIVLRLGESTETQEDPEKGVIVIDHPSKVAKLQKGKLYE